jgi:hypothetical protein
MKEKEYLFMKRVAGGGEKKGKHLKRPSARSLGCSERFVD